MKLLLSLLVLAPLCACTSEAAPRANDAGVLALGIPGAVLVEPGLVSSGQCSEAQFAQLPELGYRTVIHLRPATEQGTGWEEAQARKLGLEFIRIPVGGAQDVTEENARKLEAALKDRSGGTLVSCSSGNRVGGLFALKAYYCDKQPAEEALRAGLRAGLTKAEPEVRQKLGLPAKP
ncbi:MAG: hypothetical protein JNK02_14630 [Planctomycetes bacterium]|nr:hypothetical protein [Planctomycetota bacterium]